MRSDWYHGIIHWFRDSAIILIILLLLSGCTGIPALNREVISELNNLLILLNMDSSPRADNWFPEGIVPSDCRVVALGEAVHGSSTIFNTKRAILEHLVDNYGFRTICYEFSFEQSLDIERYITEGGVNIDSILTAQYWIQSNYEFRGLIEWMREYNLPRPDSCKIHFVGIDSQLDMFQPARLRYHMERLDPDLEGKMDNLLSNIEAFGKPAYQGMSQPCFDEINSALGRAMEEAELYYMTNNATVVIKNRDIVIRLIHSLEVSHNFLFLAYKGGENDRDRFMADNVLWAANNYGTNGKAIFWTHNAHARRDPDYYGEGRPSTGKMLQSVLGDKYLVIGTAFSGGQFVAVEADSTGHDTPPHIITIDTIPPANSVNNIFRMAAADNFLLDLRLIEPASKLCRTLDMDKPFLGVGDFFTGNTKAHYEYYEGNILDEFDLIIYHEKIEPLNLIR